MSASRARGEVTVSDEPDINKIIGECSKEAKIPTIC